jgi:hypothetical protein
MEQEIKSEVATEVATEVVTPTSEDKRNNEEFLHIKRKRLEEILNSPENTRLRRLLLQEEYEEQEKQEEIPTEVVNTPEGSPIKTNQRVSQLLIDEDDFIKRYMKFGNSKEKAQKKYRKAILIYINN